MKIFPQSGRNCRYFPQRWVTEAELLEVIPILAELQKRNFMKTFLITAALWNFVKLFPSELSCGSRTSPWHYSQSGIAAAELHEDIPLNSRIAELLEDNSFWAKLQKQNFAMTLAPERNCASGTSWRYSPLQRNFVRTFPSDWEIRKRKFDMTLLHEQSCGSGTSGRHFP